MAAYLVILISALIFYAQIPFADAKIPYASIDFEHITARNGLPSPVVYDMIQDRHGFLWFATGNGVSRFNGYEFTNYTANAGDAHSIGKGPVVQLLLDSRNTIWATSLSTGLYRFDEENDRFLFIRHDPENTNSMPSDTAYSIDEDASGNLWISTLDAGIVRYNPNTKVYTRYQHDPDNPDSLASNATVAIFCDSQGHIWISTVKNGFMKFDPTTEKFLHYLPGMPHAISIIEDQFNDIWIPTMGHGVYRYIRNEDRFVSYVHDSNDPNSISHNQVIKAFEDRSGTVWLTTWGGGFNIYDRENDRFVSYKHDPANPFSINHNSTWGVYEDHSGVIWVGTYGAGVNKFDRKKERFKVMRHYPGQHNSLSHSSVKTIHEDGDGIFWIGTLGGGMSQYNPKTGAFRHFKHDPANPNSITHNSVWNIVEDFRQNLWIGTENGLDMYDKERDRFYHFKADKTDPNSLSSDLIRSVMIDDQDQLWVGTQLHGADRLNLKGITDFKKVRFENLPVIGGHNSVLFQDSDRSVWIANQNLFRFDNTKNQFVKWEFRPADQRIAPQGLITHIAEDKDKLLWIGTTSSLFSLERKTNELKRYGPQQGLNYASIAALRVYPPDHLWISTRKGLSVMDLAGGKIKNYELGVFNRGAALTAEDGNLYFGGIHGMVSFSPNKITDNPHIPNIVITSFKKMNKEFDTGSPLPLLRDLKLSYEDRFFSFDFAALDFSDPDKNRYKYRLLGFDDNWVQVDSSRRFAAYTNLDAGNYRLQVLGSNNDGVWNDKGISIDIAITPPWWESKWFYSAVILLIAIIVALTIWYVLRLRFEINERQRVEKFLRDSEEKYRDVVEGTTDLITCVDENGNLSFVNSMANKIYGLSPEQCIGRSAFDFIHPLDREMTDAWFSECVTARLTDGTIENRHVNSQTGDMFILLWTANFHYYDDGRIKLVNSIARDITERKNMEQIIIQSEKMLSVGGLAAGMAHEINNPLAGVIQNASVMSNRLMNKEMPANIRAAESLGTKMDVITGFMESRGIPRMIRAITESSSRIASIVENMLSFARKGDSSFSGHHPEELMDKSLELAGTDYDLKKRYDFKTIIITKEYEAELPLFACEGSKIQQVLLNILNNGAHAMFTKASSDSNYTPRFILRLAHNRDTDMVEIEIEDNGTGMDEKTRKNIFEPFFTTKPVGEGTGLGLSVSYFIISENHNGTIDVLSEPGKWTKFIIHLPVKGKAKNS